VSRTVRIEILGVGCDRCNALYRRVEQVLRDEGLEGELVKVDRLDEIMKRGVLMVPGLVIDGAVKSSGCVPSVPEITAWLRHAAQG
jgi:small redox-active disulfide protein 2